eukprot:Nitzschia sp. Nitz4//scaffold297_size22919//5606//6037//NITZ4_008520-RA/size22919-processed-gene-0.28-mRNA-1//-1//CDS//3329546295//8589//frame0
MPELPQVSRREMIRDTSTNTSPSNDRDKRDRDGSTTAQKAGESSSVVDDARSPKARKLNDGTADDPVAMARQALELYRQEVKDDGDFKEPDTTPGDAPDLSEDPKESPKKLPTDTQSSSQPKPRKPLVRQPMVFAQEDDPSIL